MRESRVPRMAGNIAFGDRVRPMRLRFFGPEVTVLEGDELAGLPGVRTVANREALTGALFEEAPRLPRLLPSDFDGEQRATTVRSSCCRD